MLSGLLVCALLRLSVLFTCLTLIHAAASSSGAGAGRACRQFAKSSCLRSYADGLDEVQKGLGDSIRRHPGTVVAADPRTIVFGVGSGTTGTRSLTNALHEVIKHYGLNLKVSHWLASPAENCEWISSLLNILKSEKEQCMQDLRKFDFTAMSRSVGAILDYPVYELFIDFYLSFPNARWILTTRPSKDWASKRKGDHIETPWPMQEPCGRHIKNGTSEKLLSRVFALTNDFIRCVVPSERLLEIDVFSNPADSSMKRVRSFLGFPDSEALDLAEFPRNNTTPEKRCDKRSKNSISNSIY